ncbi:hypothetical protein Tco_0024920 [Tanacetum coccineum]
MAQLLMYSLLFAVAFTGSDSGKKLKKVHRGRARKEAEERCTLTLELRTPTFNATVWFGTPEKFNQLIDSGEKMD